jgi:GAF domain-containing protein
MNNQPFPRWLGQFVKQRVIIAIVFGVICMAIGAWLAMQASSFALAWVVASALALAWFAYQLLSAADRAQQMAESKAELERANATLNESVAALRTVRQDLGRQKMLAENLLTVARATGQRPVLEATLQNTLTICVALTGATHGSLFLFDANGRVVRHLLVKPDMGTQEARARVGQVMSDGLAGWVVRQRAAARVADTVNDPRWTCLPGDPVPFRSAMAVPLISRDMTVGVITLMHPEARHFSEEHERLLTDAADQVALALDNAQMYDNMTRLADRLSLVYEISQIATQLDLDTTLAKAVRAIRTATDWPTVAAFLLDAEQSLAARAAVGDAAQEILQRHLPPDDGVVKRAATGLQAEHIPSPASEMAAPICIGQHLLGVLYAHSAQPETFANEDLELLSAVADTLAMAAAYAELSQRNTS